jgi:hypothetical protein
MNNLSNIDDSPLWPHAATKDEYKADIVEEFNVAIENSERLVAVTNDRENAFDVADELLDAGVNRIVVTRTHPVRP